MKVCVFVDGENFRHTIGDLFTQFNKDNYLPKNADWTSLFDWIVNKECSNGQRIRTYWYVIKQLDIFPYNLPDPNRIIANTSPHTQLQAILSKHEPYKNELLTLNEPQKTTRMIDMLKDLHKHNAEMLRRFNGWTTIQEGISTKQKGIEFRRAGAMKCNLFNNTLGSEKAVDVKLAVDMITLKDMYDVALIVSGDQDYVPAVEVVKDSGKQVVNVAFNTRSGGLLPGGARRLNQIVDWHCNVSYTDFAGFLNL
jgi:uncharacterized LabA/DUF88 family protein